MNRVGGACGLSLIICTRNRSESLRRTLASLESVAVPPHVSWEVVVVDNNSRDRTRDVVEEFVRASGLNVRYVLEQSEGLSRARNAGMRAANGAILAFTDDDVIVGREWLRGVSGAFLEGDGNVAMVFGQTRRLAPGQAKVSVKEVGTRQEFTFPANPWYVGHGNNMSVRRVVAERVGEFDVRLGAGTRVGSGEDTDYIYRVLRAGERLVYSPVPIVYHDHSVDSAEQERQVWRSYARGRGAFYGKHIMRGDAWIARLFVHELRGLCVAFVRKNGERGAVAAIAGHLLLGLWLWVLLGIRGVLVSEPLRPAALGVGNDINGRAGEAR
jgi:glycosyltransferase involved in cell wall biosynthesis